MVLCLLSTLHSRLASEHTQLKDELEAVRQDNIQLVREHNHVKQVCEELRRLHDDDQREVADMRMLHQQVLVLHCCSAGKCFHTVHPPNDLQALRQQSQ